jgi:LPS export ABC transporter protein LptC
MQTLKTLFAAMTALAALAACSLDYDAGRIAQERPEDLPETILYDSSYTIERSNNRILRFTAERVESYPERDMQLLYGVSFEERNDAGEVLSAGRANEAEYFVESDDVRLTGDIRFRSEAEGAEVEAGYLYWSDEESRLSSREGERVTVVRDSGSRISGRGFVADTRLKEVSFSGDVSGRLVTEDQDTADGAAAEE